jgi:NAD(P)-binding Rossmann-like domain
MPGRTIDVDYLVVGTGAAGLAFTDSLITESHATVLLVDRRHSPGGHWNDAYPFVQLHQPSAYYGVNSRTLGADRIDDRGPNAGFYERASAAEICHYYQAVLDDLLQSGRVEFLGMTDCVTENATRARAVCRLTGAEREINVRRKIVDARYLESSIPATHEPQFEVDAGVQFIPVNDLVKSAQPAGGFVVIGAGKTAMDACNWLLDNGVDAGDVSWVKPRDAWVIDRRLLQPLDKLGDFIIGWATATEIAATSTSVAELFGRLEDAGQLRRIDTSMEPTMYRMAILSEREVDALRAIDHVIRAGHVRRIARDRIVLDDAEVPVRRDALFVDCTAEGLANPVPRPIFESHRITLQAVREGSPPFNCALSGYLEATLDDIDEQNTLMPTNPYPNAGTDWIRVRHVGLLSQQRWDGAPDVSEWLDRSRLNIAAGLITHAGEPGVGEAIGVYLEHRDRAIENLGQLRRAPTLGVTP